MKPAACRGPVVAMGAVVVVVVAMGAGRAHAAGRSDARVEPLAEIWQRMLHGLQAASLEREPPLVPPEPVTVHWQARRVSSIDLGAPLVALAAADVDGDERAELIALTTRELVIIERRGHRTLDVRGRAPLPAEPATIRPRDAVGAMTVADFDGDGTVEIGARSSAQARGAVFGYREGALVELGRFQGYPLCPGVFADLDPGRNYFTKFVDAGFVASAPAGQQPSKAKQAGEAARFDLQAGFARQATERFFAARCRGDLVDPLGRRLRVMALVQDSGWLRLVAERRCPRRDSGCQQGRVATRGLADNGVAFEIADVDRDGHIEVAVTARTAPGDADRVTVLSWQGDKLRRVFSRDFSGGVIGLTSGDMDGDGITDLVAAVRLWGSHRVDLWTFN